MKIEYINGKKKFRCYGRNELFNPTPEEEVRQTLLKKLIEENKIPFKMLSVEKRLDKYGAKTNYRADIIINHHDKESDTPCPLVLIECKRSDEPLTYKVLDQIERYNQYLNVSIVGMTNGKETSWLKIDETSGDY